MRCLLTTLLAVFISNNSLACDKKPLSIEDATQAADVIFTAQVSNIQYLDDPEQTKTEPRIIVTLITREVWKGEQKQQYRLHTTHNKGSCNGYVFKSGEHYLIFARKQNSADHFLVRLFASKEATIGVKIYGGTKRLRDAENDLKMLNQILGPGLARYN